MTITAHIDKNQPPPRVGSIDVFRGVTILLMIFVNHLGRHEMVGVPAWMKHAPSDISAMTFVDVVFPAFLFIVGMAIPLALQRRLERGESAWRIAAHVALRSGGLLIIGVLMCNIGPLDSEATGLSKPAWTLLMFAGVILAWNQYPRSADRASWHFVGLRLVGVGLLLAAASVYRGSADGEIVWLRTYWWGILGLIGWAYLACTFAFVLTRGSPVALMGALGLWALLFVGDAGGALNALAPIKRYLWLGGHLGSHALLATAGMLVTLTALRPAELPVRGRIGRMLVFGVGLALAGWLLQPSYGISKVGATPSWALYSAAICCGVFALLYLVVDVWGLRGWAAAVRPAAVNPLLAYILPDIFFALLGVLGATAWHDFMNEGALAILRAALFSCAMLAVTALLTRWHVRLHL